MEKEREADTRPPALREVSVEKLALTVDEGVLIDGGASLNVYYSAEIPKGAVERDVELAHGSKTGYIIDDDIIFLDNSMIAAEGLRMCIISLGRFTNYGAKISWDKRGASLTVLGGKRFELHMHNKCPHASPEVVTKFEELKKRNI